MARLLAHRFILVIFENTRRRQVASSLRAQIDYVTGMNERSYNVKNDEYSVLPSVKLSSQYTDSHNRQNKDLSFILSSTLKIDLLLFFV